MQVLDIGRNDTCPCGSGRKFKKCCLGKQASALDADAGEADVAALVDRALADDDWDEVHDVFDRGFVLFDPAAPLEHMRFRADLVPSTMPDRVDFARMCGGGWLRSCDGEITRVLHEYDLEPDHRTGLRMALHLLRRFGATSPVVESVATLQVAERRIRERRLASASARLGIRLEDVARDGRHLEWIERGSATVLSFADWFALQVAGDDIEAVWLSSVSTRACDVCLEELEKPDPADAKAWTWLAWFTLSGAVPRIATALARCSPPRTRDDDERVLFTALASTEPPPRIPRVLGRIIEATETRRDYAGAAMLREARHRLRAGMR